MRVLLLNQAFHPDVVATALYTSDLARELVARGHSVTAIASMRAYDSPEQQYPLEERWEGIHIRRIWATGFGKDAKWRRIADFASFSVSCLWRLLWAPQYDVVVALTSPPWISFLAALLVRVRGGRMVYWVMDLNPDAAVAAGYLPAGSIAARVLEWMSRYSLRRASTVIALDRFMADRIAAKGIAREHIAVLPPWAHTESLSFDHAGREEFRRRYGLTGKFVVMYSGNHSPVHPLTTLLDAALALREESQIHFCFIGGGSEFRRVKEFAAGHGLSNILCLPYQPRAGLPASLSAADLHTVVMGDAFVGIVHPCKIYNILALGTPVLYVGPFPSHVGDLTAGKPSWVYVAPHGHATAVAKHIKQAARRSELNITEAQETAGHYGHNQLIPRHIAVIESDRPATLAVAACPGTSTHR